MATAIVVTANNEPEDIARAINDTFRIDYQVSSGTASDTVIITPRGSNRVNISFFPALHKDL